MNYEEVRSKIYLFGERAMQDFAGEDVASLTPEKTDNYLSFLSGYSALLEERMGDLEVLEAQNWGGLRSATKTNEEAKRNWQSTPAGLEQMKLARLLKAVDKIIAACKRRMDRFRMESYNQV